MKFFPSVGRLLRRLTATATQLDLAYSYAETTHTVEIFASAEKRAGLSFEQIDQPHVTGELVFSVDYFQFNATSGYIRTWGWAIPGTLLAHEYVTYLVLSSRRDTFRWPLQRVSRFELPSRLGEPRAAHFGFFGRLDLGGVPPGSYRVGLLLAPELDQPVSSAVPDDGSHENTYLNSELHGNFITLSKNPYGSSDVVNDLLASPYFHEDWYKQTYEACISSSEPAPGQTGLADNLAIRNPHPLFRSEWYRASYLAGHFDTAIPLVHYVEQGWRRGNRPHPLFWTEWYRNTYLSDADQFDPFLHFITIGWKDNCHPNPLFDVKFYSRHFMGRNSMNLDPLSHYLIEGWRRGADPHPLFHTQLYLERRGTTLDEMVVSPLEELLLDRHSPSPHYLFDSSYYESKIARRAGEEALPAIAIYLLRGPAGVESPHPFFNKQHYLDLYQDIKAVGVDPLIHYVSSGHTEHRSPHPLFDSRYYADQTPEAAGTNPLIHYLTYGVVHERPCRPPEPPDTTVRPLPSSRVVVTVPDEQTGVGETGARHNITVGIFAHIFHLDVCDELVEAFNNIKYSCRLFVSTDTLVKRDVIRQKLTTGFDHQFEIRIVPNRGRDIAPMIVGFRDRITEVDIGLHIHTKKSVHYGTAFDEWRRYLVYGNLGSPSIVDKIISLLMQRPLVGIYAPDHFAPIRKLLSWGGNFRLLKGLLSILGEELRPENTLDFPSGSMFWFKPAALKPLLNLDLRFYHFDPEFGQVDGTLAHAIERGLFMFAEIAGFEWIVGEVMDSGRRQLPALCTNRFFPTSNDLGDIRRYLPECTRFMLRPSPCDRPRLNLLVPTLDSARAYAGVDTALGLFHRLRAAVGSTVDARMIATDAPLTNRYNPPRGFKVVLSIDDDRSEKDVVIDATQRTVAPLFVREHDIFVATAWWTARNVLDIIAWQEEHFGTRWRRFVYLIQDFECGFYPWSIRYVLAENTYRFPAKTIPIFNTPFLFEYFKSAGYFQDGVVLEPGINGGFEGAIRTHTKKEKKVILYMRPHAQRNCLEFIDLVISEALRRHPSAWDDWQFLAIGEDFDSSVVRVSNRIQVVGRLSLEAYADLASRAALGISLMISPHPSYPPLEMASAGVLVLTNKYGSKDLTDVHANIHVFSAFDPVEVADQLTEMAIKWAADPECGWHGQKKISWFFGQQSNVADVVARVVNELFKEAR